MKTVIIIAAFTIVDAINPDFQISEKLEWFYMGLFVVCITTDIINFVMKTERFFR